MILSLYGGPGGWCEGLRLLGLSSIGIEWDAAACATRHAAGHRTIRADVTAMPAAHLRGKVDLLIASPPCTAFSMAGKGAGREVLAQLTEAMYRGDWTAMRDDHPMVVWAPLDVGRWIEDCQPSMIALEQVPPALPLWDALGHWLRAHGWHAEARVLNAADYGVPQTRKRAFLVAGREPVALPEPTHERTPVDSFFGTKAKWVSMADALGWGMTERPVVTLTAGSGRQGGPDPLDGGSGARAAIKRERERDRWLPKDAG